MQLDDGSLTNYLLRLRAQGLQIPQDMEAEGPDALPQNMLARLQQDAQEPTYQPTALSRAVPGQGFQGLESGQGVVQAGNGPVIRINSAPSQPQDQSMAADVTRPIEIAGRGKGYYSKDGTSAIINGQKILLGYDREKTQANQDRAMKLQQFDLSQRKGEQDIAHTQQQIEESKAKIANAKDANAPRLGQSERFGANGEVELIPGTSAYLKQMEKYKNDKTALDAANLKTDNALRTVSQILTSPEEKARYDAGQMTPEEKKAYEDKDAGFQRQFGGYNAKLFTQFLPGAGQDAKQKIETLKSQMKSAGLDLIRAGGGIGAMTEREWPIVEKQIDAIDPMMGEPAARDAINNIANMFETARRQAMQRHAETWGGTQFARNGTFVDSVPPKNPNNLQDITTQPRIKRKVSEEEIQATARARGMSPAEVKRQLGL